MGLYPDQTTSVIIPADVEPISTERLHLRPLHMNDAPAIFQIRKLEDVANWL